MYQKNGSFRKLEERERPSSEDDVIRFTTTAFQGSPTRIDLDAIGYTAANYEFELYRKSTTLDIVLEFPLNRDTDSSGDWWTASSPNVTALLDLDRSDDAIQIRNAQEGTKSDGCLTYNENDNKEKCSQVSTPNLKAFKTSSGNDWNVSWVEYHDAYSSSGETWLWYDNHNGYDYAVPEGENVTASNPGKVDNIDSPFGEVEIIHENGYKTIYTHMKNIQVNENDEVFEGQKLGEVSNTSPNDIGVHLHFTVRDASGNLLDPYGGSYNQSRPYMWE